MTTLQEFRQKANQAHNWTSFVPEKRGEQLINDYEAQLNQDIETLKTNYIEDDIINSYIIRYKSLFSSWLSAKGNCTSAMITGPANYNVRRHEKSQRSEERHYDLWQEWRLKSVKAILRKNEPAKTYSSELERYKYELESAKSYHALSIEGNKKIKAAKKTGANIDQYLTETFGIKPHMLDHTKQWGFDTTNNKIKRIEQMIKTLEAKEQMNVENQGQKEIFKSDLMTIVSNFEIDRLQIFTESKPEPNIISLFKSNGFKWAPCQKAWQRQLTPNAISSAKRIINSLEKS